MSLKAMDWAFDSGIPPGQRLVLIVLGEHAGDHKGEDWTCFPAMQRLAERSGFSIDSIERHLQWLVREGWISRRRRTGRARTEAVYDYTLHRTKRGEPPRTLPDGQGAQPPGNLRGRPEATTPQSDSGPPRKSTPTTPQSDSAPPDPPYTAEPSSEPSDEPKNGCGARERGLFDQVLSEWVAAKRSSRTDPEASWSAWREVLLAGEAAERLAARVRQALAEDPDFRRRGPPGFQKWLGEGRWRNWPGEAGASAAAGGARGRFAEEQVREAVVASQGETYARAYLDPADWIEADRAIRPLTNMARDRLRRDLAPLFGELGVKVLDKA